MSCALKCSVAFSVAAMLLASSSVAEAGKKCAGTSVTTVAFKKEAKMDIVDTAVNAGSFKTLAAALKAAGLVDTLKGKGPFTVFAPTDEAFAKLPAGTVETLLKPENKAKLVGDSDLPRCRRQREGRRRREAEIGEDRARSNRGDRCYGWREDQRRQGGQGRHRLRQRRDPRDRHRSAAQGIVRGGQVMAGE